MEAIVVAGITLVAEVLQIIAKAVADKNADVATVKAAAAASVTKFLATVDAMPTVLAANDAAADAEAKK